MRARELELTSDWEGLPKELAFASLVVAARRAWPDGASVAVGVFRGGTSAILMLASRPGSFHVAVDPYGLPGQSYPIPEYEDWATFRGTARRLFELADDCGITFCHYLMDSLTFVRGDLLQHPGTFNIVHLDGDHSYAVVKAELAYFTGKLASPTLYLLDDDDDDDNYPGVAKAAREIPTSCRCCTGRTTFRRTAYAGSRRGSTRGARTPPLAAASSGAVHVPRRVPISGRRLPRAAARRGTPSTTSAACGSRSRGK